MEEECPICFDVYDVHDVITVLNCHHEYHQKCLLIWGGDICPLCRAPMYKDMNIEQTHSVSVVGESSTLCCETTPLLLVEDNYQNDIPEIAQSELYDITDKINIQFPCENPDIIAFKIIDSKSNKEKHLN
uniref:E3 ubiquitin-protein ligase RNF128 (Trinotate prediction) n=1 Tax=Henneguya salminicola TaxID=69463 RepID=A0A6G3MFR5_HENSL